MNGKARVAAPSLVRSYTRVDTALRRVRSVTHSNSVSRASPNVRLKLLGLRGVPARDGSGRPSGFGDSSPLALSPGRAPPRHTWRATRRARGHRYRGHECRRAAPPVRPVAQLLPQPWQRSELANLAACYRLSLAQVHSPVDRVVPTIRARERRYPSYVAELSCAASLFADCL